ncbi:CPBP family intramembrane glutamic endopeptidase [Nonomuraea sp. SYSU D8015]|uniref:CPBP family intramembrane glutamic endopeptidase n=1 Tax=Nonomuraea sp. SYSU D8015 TaxID=2593644 RepID=UPI00166186BC|nr:CPBP family intramembrane glutamic endopeptidase [Nonomuraea sp. SYSU D8015]
MAPTDSRRAPSVLLMTGAGVAVFALAYAWLIVTGNTEVAQSADPGATPASLWAAALPPLAAIVLARLVPARIEVPLPTADLPRPRLRREAWTLVAAAVLMAMIGPLARGELHVIVKVLVLLVLPLAAFRLIRGDGPRARTIIAPVTWLAPLPAVLAWFLLSEVSPLAVPLTQDLPDPLTLAVASLVTLLTAGVLEEVFYRAWLQTRLEVLYGGGPAIMASALLFAFMHSSRIDAGDPLLGMATIVAFQGMFGLMQGYLWARYRNVWMIIFMHVIINLVYVPMLLGRL